ncbi:MAG TPA: VOC family protein [Acidimicrobiales bacterium]|nr:VOC family protein [Acidimicrobiales bacterium]
MPLRETAPIGAPCWVDLFTSDTDRAQEFYGDLFGWTAESAGEDYGGYINFSKGGHQVAGCMKNDGTSGMPDVWSVYLATDNAEGTAARAATQGAQVIVPAMDVMALGEMAVLLDVGQAAIGAWQPGLHNGFAILGEPGTPNWFELHTRDYDASVKFYRDVFKWDTHVMSDTADFRYTTFGEGEAALAGIMDAKAFLPNGVPANWQIYFGVENADAALAKIVKLGGSVIMGPDDSPYGRLAQAADPTGAVFKIVQA